MPGEPIQAHPRPKTVVETPRRELEVNVFPDGDNCVVEVSGELDVTTRNQLLTASTAGDHPTMVINLAGVTFMDCSGVGALVESRQAIEGAGRMLTVRGATGQPAHLLALIADREGTHRAVGF